MTLSDTPSPPIDLAGEPDFRLGQMIVSPSRGQVAAGGSPQRVEPRAMEVLIVLARAAGETVTRDRLIEACWGGRAVSDDAIARIIAKVRALTRGMEPAPFTLHTVPKVGFRLETGEAPADEAAPAEASTGMADGASNAAEEAPPASRRWPVAALLGVGALVLAGTLAWAVLWRPGENAPPVQNGRVEVAAFSAQGGDAALDRLAPLMSGALLQTLVRSGIVAGAGPHPGEGGAAGDAELQLTGSLSRSGDAVSASVHLVDRASGLVLWSGGRTHALKSVDRQPRDVARQVTATLRCALDYRGASRAAMTPDVFGLFLSACEANEIESQYGRALGVSRQLVKAAPGISGAHALHAIAAAWTANETDAGDQIVALRQEAHDAAWRALALDPRSAEAYAALAVNEGQGANFAARERHLRQALAIDPGAWPARPLAAVLLFETGRVNEGIEYARRIVESGDPRADGFILSFALRVAANGDTEGAKAILAQDGIVPDKGVAEGLWTIAFWWSGLEAARTAPRPADGEAIWAACYDRYLALLAKAGGAGLRGLPAGCAQVQADWRVRLLAREGDIDGAYAAIDALPNSLSIRYFLFYPETKAFRADPRFMKLAARLGLVDYWRGTGRWPDFCAAPDLPYDCKAAAEALR